MEKQSKKAPAKLNYLRGALFALGGPVAGIIAAVLIWHMGFIASISSFLTAWLTVWLFTKGAGGIDRKALGIVLPYIILGVVLAFFACMLDDLFKFAYETSPELAGVSPFALFFDGDFMAYVADNLFNNPALWQEYLGSIAMWVLFAALGTFGSIKDLILGTKQ